MTARWRQVMVEVKVDDEYVQDVLEVECSFSFANPVASARYAAVTEYGSYDSEVQINIGCFPGTVASPGDDLPTRFKGRQRDKDYQFFPRAIIRDCMGTLGRAAEYINAAGANVGGLYVWDLVGGGMPPPPVTATAAQIISAVLTIAGVDHDPANIHSTGRLYGTYWEEFKWHAGTPPANVGLRIQEAGETALDYIRRYNQIEAEVVLNDADEPVSGGFYVIGESLGGTIYCVLVGGRPRADVWDFVLSEDDNILTDHFYRRYPKANRVVVKGRDMGIGLPFNASRVGSNGPMGDSPHYDRQAPTSSMIEWATRAQAETAGFGMDCETVADARYLQVNREGVEGTVETPEDYIVGQGQTHLVTGTYDPETDATSPGRQGTNEKLWCIGVTIRVTLAPDGAPILRQTFTYEGGGLPDTMLGGPPA